MGDKPVAFVPPIPGLFSQHLPAMEIMVAAGGTQIPLWVWVVVDHDQGCFWVAMPCWASESHDGRSCHAVPGHLSQREGEMTQVGLSFKYCSSLRLTCKTHWRFSTLLIHFFCQTYSALGYVSSHFGL